jgi:adenine-specific DNA-methyltransferase
MHNVNSDSQKEAGSYYTPQRLADYVVYRLFSEGGYAFGEELDVLEPSVGDGIFLDALLNGNYYKDTQKLFEQTDQPRLIIDAIEIDQEVAKKTKAKSKSYDDSLGKVRVKNSDCLDYFLGTNKKYDLIIGNPPYVRRRNMSKSTQELCALVHKAAGIADEKPKNLWTSFFAGAKSLLKEKGVIAFVLPTDLLQVKYAQEIREILYRDFERVEVFSLNWIYFDDIEQDVVIMICSNGHGKDRPKFCHINSLEDLEKPKHYVDYDNSQRTTLNKWTNYVLSAQEFKFLDAIHERIKPMQVRDYCDSGAGIVTAANNFFIVNKQVVETYKLKDITKSTIKKSSSMFPAVILTKNDLLKKADAGAEVFFIDFPDKSKNELPNNYITYLQIGEDQGLHQRYKMLKRENWYAVPSVWSSEAFFTKRSNIFPRIIVNDANAYVTDAFYRIRMKNNINARELALAFHNTFTFIYAELSGRYYGGGVLELTPNEFKDLPVPNSAIASSAQSLSTFDRLMRNGKTTRELLDFSDNIVLKEGCGLSSRDIVKLRTIYLKLLRRRLKKSDFNI